MEKDFFISYNEADSNWAKWVAGTLEEHGYKTIIQAWDFKPGNNFVLEMQKAISSCKRTILILSQSYLKSRYCQAEWASIFNADPTGKKAELIPIRVEDVKPEGLLSNIIYIDLFDQPFGQQDDVAVKKLLDGVGYSENPRKKSKFPLSQMNGNSGKQLENDNEVQFLFDLEEDNSVEFLISTKNDLREWYYSNHKSKFNVKINDKRQSLISVHLNEIKTKSKQHNLTEKEEFEYQKYIRVLERCKYESQLKEKAIEFFLKDNDLQTYLCINNYLEVLDIVKSILKYDYYDQQKPRDKYVYLDIFLDPAPKEFRRCLVVCIEREKIDKQFGGHSQYDLFDLYVIDFDRDTIIKDIVIGYYLFLSEEILHYNNVELLHNKNAMNLFKYKVGLH